MALAHGAGIALPLAGIPFQPVLWLLLCTLPLLRLWSRPAPLLALSLAAGVVAGEATLRGMARDCRLQLPSGTETEVTGRFLGRAEPGRAVPFRVEEGLPGGCRATLRAVWPRALEAPPTGARLRVPARWEGRSFPDPGRAEWAGRLRLDEGARPVRGGDLHGRLLRVRGAVLDRIARLWGERAPMVEALVVARREHLDPDLREAFALSGTAHLLAISGFHVGVVAGLLLALLRAAGLRPRPAAAGAAFGSWAYVLAIGAPDAALRAAVVLTLLAASRLRGVPTVPVGALSSAFLLLLVVDPGALASVGFQLSFAGTLGLVTLRRPLEGLLDRGWRRMGRRPPRRRPGAGAGERWLRGSSEGVVAGAAATLPTLPLLAWHFDRVSLVGIPATLALAPLVSLAIPGIGTALGLSVLAPPAGGFVAWGVGILLAGLEAGVRHAAALPGASVWVSREALLGGCGAGLLAALLLRGRAGRIRPPVRRGAAVFVGAAAVLLLPLLPGPAALEVHLLDVGQGDALALRLPSGRWIAVDAGPRGPGWDAGARRVLPHLRRHGVRTLEALVLTHPHLDHIGGAPALLRGLRVRGVLDPSRPAPSAAYLQVMEAAREEGASWWPAEAGTGVVRDGVELRVLHPGRRPRPAEIDPAAPPGDLNDLSVVLLVRWGAAAILLTGDAYQPVEEAVLGRIPALTILKVGHHGSRTSTSEALLRAVRPEWALIGVGDGNRYGHPHPEVLERLDDAGTRVLRTDRDGTVRLRIRRDGRVEVRGR